MERISVEQFKKINKKKSKYNSQKTEYNGRIYDSKKEAEYAKRLEWLRHAKNKSERVDTIDYQVPYKIYIKNTYVFTYFADFRVVYADGRVEVIDVKGYKTSIYRLKKKCVETYYDFKIIEV